MNTCTRVLATLSLAALSAHAVANPELKSVTPTFYQSTNGSLNAGMIVAASTDLPVLIIGGGFTITCTTSSLPQTAERVATFADFFGPDAKLMIPPVVPSAYPIPGAASIPAGTCSGQCVMQYKGEARDETDLSVRVGNQGVGVNFTLIPSGEQRLGNTLLTDICRQARRQCCTPGCVAP
jgi:hypothetical protein